MTPRTFTPNEVTVNEDGRKRTTMHLKRGCNGCGTSLGDIENRDVNARGNLTDVRGECPNCAPLVALEAAGCRTWRLTQRSITETSFARWRRFAKAVWGAGADGQRILTGLEFTAGPGHEPVTVLFGDWIVRHPDGAFTVHTGPKAGEQA